MRKFMILGAVAVFATVVFAAVNIAGTGDWATFAFFAPFWVTAGLLGGQWWYRRRLTQEEEAKLTAQMTRVKDSLPPLPKISLGFRGKVEVKCSVNSSKGKNNDVGPTPFGMPGPSASSHHHAMVCDSASSAGGDGGCTDGASGADGGGAD